MVHVCGCVSEQAGFCAHVWDVHIGLQCLMFPSMMSWCCGFKQDEMHIQSTLYTLVYGCVIYMWPQNTHRYTHTFSLEPRFEEGGSGNLWGGAWLGEEAKEPSLTWGMGPEGTKPHSLLRHVENGKRARGGGERSKKKWRKKEEGATISGIC